MAASSMQSAVAGLVLITACAPAETRPGTPPSTASKYLFVWAGAERDTASDFLAVIDVDSSSQRYGTVVATVPVGVRGMAHHTEHQMPPGDTLFVNAYHAGATFLIDLSTPTAPRVVGDLRGVGAFRYPHSYERLPNGNVLTTFQATGEGNKVPGGLVELDPAGQPIRTVPAADPADPELRPYSVTAIPSIDRAVSTTSDMEAVAQGSSFQVWRLSDLKLLATVPLPRGPRGYEHKDPAEIRLLADGTAIMTTFSCAMYRLHDLTTDHPRAELIQVLPWATYDTDDCAVPVTRGRYWVQTFANAKGSALISFDLSDPSHPVEVDRLTLSKAWKPHWLSIEPAGDRIVVTSGQGATYYTVLIVRLDPASGRLALDSTFREPGSAEPGVRFDREVWPHGPAGPAIPHGAVFSRTKPTPGS
jgi:hypothetical protein